VAADISNNSSVNQLSGFPASFTLDALTMQTINPFEIPVPPSNGQPFNYNVHQAFGKQKN
jgi:hypothetical protein